MAETPAGDATDDGGPGDENRGGRGDERCPVCSAPTVFRPVPDGCRGLLPDDPRIVRVCTRCLHVEGAPGRPVDRDWEPAELSEALPSDAAGAVGIAMLVTFLDSLVLNRREIGAVVTYLEADAGVDPLSALERLADDPALSIPLDLRGRRTQLAQLLE